MEIGEEMGGAAEIIGHIHEWASKSRERDAPPSGIGGPIPSHSETWKHNGQSRN